ncbi:hypothetical protein PEBR_05582 [Penicillium brasilianum]|uniref:Alpha/beta hydrolase fold-3 domain-containing protein n=1 Tax=Penicillium brasilianum TaxID=104259 RepID=A0A1S9RXH4_PENBI|nr:hypothetical protein PEBR_05582 [Penicillium brasilianum]
MGGSTGDNWAASITLEARDRRLSPPITRQILVYPMLDNPYLGAEFDSDRESVAGVEGLPPTYLEIGILDIYRDEVLRSASRIVAANIVMKVDFYPGQPHGYDKLAPVSAAAQRAITDRVHAASAL